MMNVLGRSATEYGLWFILVSAAFMVGNLVAGRFSAGSASIAWCSPAPARGRRRGAGLALLLGGFWVPLALFGPIMAVGLGNGFAVPNAQAGAVSVQPLLAGLRPGLPAFRRCSSPLWSARRSACCRTAHPTRWRASWPAARCCRSSALSCRGAGPQDRLVGQEVRIESLLERVGRGSWKRLRATWLPARARPRIRHRPRRTRLVHSSEAGTDAKSSQVLPMPTMLPARLRRRC